MFRNRFYIPVPLHFALFVSALFWLARMIVRLGQIVWRQILLPAHRAAAEFLGGLRLRSLNAQPPLAEEEPRAMAQRRIEEIRRRRGDR